MNKALAELKEQTRFYISTPERAAEALLFVRNLEDFAERVKESVKERAVRVMDEKNIELMTYSIIDPETGEVKEWELRRAYGTVRKEYRPENVLKALGEKSIGFFKVEKSKLEKFLKTAHAKKEISDEVVTLATKDPVEKSVAGAGVVIKEKKPSEKFMTEHQGDNMTQTN